MVQVEPGVAPAQQHALGHDRRNDGWTAHRPGPGLFAHAHPGFAASPHGRCCRSRGRHRALETQQAGRRGRAQREWRIDDRRQDAGDDAHRRVPPWAGVPRCRRGPAIAAENRNHVARAAFEPLLGRRNKPQHHSIAGLHLEYAAVGAGQRVLLDRRAPDELGHRLQHHRAHDRVFEQRATVAGPGQAAGAGARTQMPQRLVAQPLVDDAAQVVVGRRHETHDRAGDGPRGEVVVLPPPGPLQLGIVEHGPGHRRLDRGVVRLQELRHPLAQVLAVTLRDVAHGLGRLRLEGVARRRIEGAGVARGLLLVEGPVEAIRHQVAVFLQSEPVFQEARQDMPGDIAHVDVQFPARLAVRARARVGIGDPCLQNIVGIGARVRVPVFERELLDRAVAGRRLTVVLGAGVQAQEDRPDGLRQPLLIAVHRVAQIDVGQDLLDPVCVRHQHAVGRAQQAAVRMADRGPDRSGPIFAPALRIFERRFPTGQGDLRADAGFERAQAFDIRQAFCHVPGNRRRLGRGGGPGSGLGPHGQVLDTVQGRGEEIGAPGQAHQRRRLDGEFVVAVECHANDAAPVFETEEALAPGLGDAADRIGRGRRCTRTVATRQPALHDLELLADAGVVGHEEQALLVAALRHRVGVRHAAPKQPRRPGSGHRAHFVQLDAVARAGVGAPDVGRERALGASRVLVVIEIVQALSGGDQWRAVGVAAHQLGLDEIGIEPDGGDGGVERRDVLLQLAHDQVTRVLQQRPQFGAERGLRVGRIGMTHQCFAQMDLVRKEEGVLGAEYRIGVAIGVAEVIDDVFALVEVAAQPLDRQGPHAFGQCGETVFQFLGERGFAGAADSHVQQGVYGVQRHAGHVGWRCPCRIVDRGRPVQRGQRPAPRVVGLHIAEHAGPALHALLELDRQPVEHLFAHTAGPQALERQCDIDAALRSRPRALGRRHELAQEGGRGSRAVEGHQADAAPLGTLDRTQDAGLRARRQGGVGGRQWRLLACRRQRPALHQPHQCAAQAFAGGVLDVGAVLAGLPHANELRQQLVGGVVQQFAVRCLRRVQVGQAIDAGQPLQTLLDAFALARRNGLGRVPGERPGLRVAVALDQLPRDVLGIRDRALGDKKVDVGLAALEPVLHAQRGGIAFRHRRRAVIERRVDLP